MKTTTQIFVPKKQVEKIIREVDVDTVLALTEESYKISQDSLEPGLCLESYLGFVVNFGNPRYHVLNNNRRCSCCKIAITHAFLEHDTDDAGNDIEVFNFYAETKDKDVIPHSHMVLITLDHIKPKRNGGSDDIDNLRTMCVSCNWALTNLNCSVVELQHALFDVYRIYRSSLVLRFSDKTLAPCFRKIKKNRIAIEKITQNLFKANEQNQVIMRARIITTEARLKELEYRIETERVKAQQTGIEVDAATVSLL